MGIGGGGRADDPAIGAQERIIGCRTTAACGERQVFQSLNAVQMSPAQQLLALLTSRARKSASYLLAAGQRICQSSREACAVVVTPLTVVYAGVRRADDSMVDDDLSAWHP